jgi:hypothetical protein
MDLKIREYLLFFALSLFYGLQNQPYLFLEGIQTSENFVEVFP